MPLRRAPMPFSGLLFHNCIVLPVVLLLQAIDLTFLHFSLSRTLKRGVSVHLLFAFEYTVQASTIVLTFVKYCL